MHYRSYRVGGSSRSCQMPLGTGEALPFIAPVYQGFPFSSRFGVVGAKIAGRAQDY